MVARQSYNESVKRADAGGSGGGEGVKVITNESRVIPDGPRKGTEAIYTLKHYFIKQSIPGWARWLVPESASVVEEKAWNAYPWCLTEYTYAFLGQKFELSIETMHVDKDIGEKENALNIGKDILKQRQVEHLNLYNNEDRGVYKNDDGELECDPTQFKTGLEEYQSRFTFDPKSPTWAKEAPKTMGIYKLVKAKMAYWGIQTKAENAMHEMGPRAIVFNAHRQLLMWFDEWIKMDMAALRVYEAETEKKLAKIFAPAEDESTEASTTTPEGEPTSTTSSSTEEVTTSTSTDAVLASTAPS